MLFVQCTAAIGQCFSQTLTASLFSFSIVSMVIAVFTEILLLSPGRVTKLFRSK